MQDLGSSTFCPVAHATNAHLTGGAAYYGDDRDELARDLAADASELAYLCEKSTGLRIAICEIALAMVPDRFGAIVEAIKEHAVEELDRRLEIDAEAHA